MWILLPAVIFSFAALGTSATAQVAVVEEVNSRSANVEVMDYVAVGKVIKLAAQDTMVLGYMKSCVREVITGGVVIVGAEQSDVALGDVKRTKVACDGGQMKLSSNQSSQSAGIIIRGIGGEQEEVRPEITLFGLSPVFEVGGRGTLLVSRLDQPSEQIKLAITSDQQLVRRSFVDLAKTGTTLAAGGTYQASFGNRKVVFKVDPTAQPGPSPVIGRLIRFQAGK
jgi:hypothetical protein